MRKKVFICKSKENDSDYFVYDEHFHAGDDDVWFNAYKVIWDDFERCYCSEIESMTFEEIEEKFLQFEKEWVDISPNFGIFIERFPPANILL